MEITEKQREYIKQMISSIFVGVAIAALTALIQGLLHVLQDIKPVIPATTVGMTHHITKWLSHQNV